MPHRLLLVLAVMLISALPTLAEAQSGRHLGGLGRIPKGAMEGDELVLPPGVAVVSVRGYLEKTLAEMTPTTEDDCKETHPPQGSGALVQVCIGFSYSPPPNVSRTTPIRIVIPPLTAIESIRQGYQHGVSIRGFTVTIRPGQTIYVPALLYCLNNGKHASEPGLPYKIGPALKDREFRKLSRLTANKRIDIEPAAEIQSIIHSLSEGGLLTPADEAFISALPDEPETPLP